LISRGIDEQLRYLRRQFRIIKKERIAQINNIPENNNINPLKNMLLKY